MGKIQYNCLQCKIDIACLPIKHESDILILWCHCKNVGEKQMNGVYRYFDKPLLVCNLSNQISVQLYFTGCCCCLFND